MLQLKDNIACFFHQSTWHECICMRVLMACQLYVLQLMIVGWALGGQVFGTIFLSSFFIELPF